MFGKLVVGFDETPGARDAAALGQAFAQATGATLHLVDVFYDIPGPLPDALRGEMREHAEHALRQAGRDLPPDVAASKHLIAERSPARGLSDFAESTGADVIVLGSSRDAQAGRVTSGRLARRIVQGSPCAVALAPAGLRDRSPLRLARIGVAVDGQPECEEALIAAAELARASGASLIAIAAVDSPDPVVGQFGASAERLVRESLHSAAQHALDHAVETVPAGVALETRLQANGPVVGSLATVAREAGLDLLVMGSRAFGPVRRVLLGSVSAELMADAPCALLIVPRGSHATTRIQKTALESAQAQ